MATEVILPKIGFSMSEGTLGEWLVNHIQKSDKKYSDHMNAHGVH